MDASDNPAVYRRISPAQAMDHMKNGALILDVRGADEYSKVRIKEAVNIPLDRLESTADEIEDKSAKILVYCRSGQRSARAARLLVDLGFTDVYDIGGILDWPYDETVIG